MKNTKKIIRRHRRTHNGQKTATTLIREGFTLYFSKANTKSMPTFLTLGATNPETGEFTKIRLDGRQVNSLKAVINKF